MQSISKPTTNNFPFVHSTIFKILAGEKWVETNIEMQSKKNKDLNKDGKNNLSCFTLSC